MAERLTGISSGIQVRTGNVIPLCPNSAPGEGNCKGMIKYDNCPVSRGLAGKHDGCSSFFEEHKSVKTLE